MYSPGQAATVSLGILCFVDELVPVTVAGRQDLFVGEPDCHSCRMEGIFEQFEGAAEVALPAGHVADQENVEGAVPRGIEHGHHFRAAIDGPARVGCSPNKTGILQAEPADRAVLQFDLSFGAVSVELACGGLAYPASGAKTAQGVG